MSDPIESAQAEAARQAVVLVFSVAGVLLAVAAQRASSDPDFYRSQRMAFAKRAERALATLAARSWRAAEKARLAYEEETA